MQLWYVMVAIHINATTYFMPQPTLYDNYMQCAAVGEQITADWMEYLTEYKRKDIAVLSECWRLPGEQAQI